MDYKPNHSQDDTFIVNVMVHKRILSYFVYVVSDVNDLKKFSTDYDVVLICFSAANRQSFKNVATWAELCREKLQTTPYKPEMKKPDPELKGLWSDVSSKIVLIGTHLDVALDKQVNQELLVSFREADRMAESIGANLYRECSSKKLTGLADLFVSVSGLLTPLEKLEAEPGKPSRQTNEEHKQKDCSIQ